MDKVRKWGLPDRRQWPLLVALVAIPLGAWWAYVSSADTEFPGDGGRLSTPATAEELSLVAFTEVQAQIRSGVRGPNGNSQTSWSSQPGAIRSFSQTDATGEIFKLYSAEEMQVDGRNADLGSDVPADWDAQPDQFVDLNSPTVAAGGELNFPIADPRAFAGGNSPDSAEGFSYSADINGVVPPDPVSGSNDAQRLPMPVRWRYVLKHGETGTLDAQNQWVGNANPSANNPIVGRVAYWTDDLSCRINVNTASEGVYWDTPRADTLEERAYAEMQPARDEFQRHPGHPAQVSLSSVVFPNRRYYLPGTDGDLDPLTLAEAEQLWRIAPGVGTGGSKGGTRRIAEDEAPLVAEPVDYQLYDSLEELASTTPALSPEASQRLKRGEFLLTTESNAPEMTLRGTPRIAMWPVPANVGQRSPFDQKLARIGTLGETEYFFQRHSRSDLHSDHYFQADGNNALLIEHLRSLDDLNFPGYPGVRLYQKYGNGEFEEWRQLSLAMFGYVRACNSFDPTAPVQFTPAPSDPGYGQVSAVCACGGNSPHSDRWYRKFSPYALAGARSYDISEIALVFVVSGYVDPQGNAFGDSNSLAPGQRRFEVGLVVETFCPASGVRQIRPRSRMVVASETRGGNTDNPLIRMTIDSEVYTMNPINAAASSAPDQGGSGGLGMFARNDDNSGFSWSRSGNLGKQFIVSGETMTIEALGVDHSVHGFDIVLYSADSNTVSRVWKMVNYRPTAGDNGQIEIPSPQLPQDLSTIGTWEDRLEAAESNPQNLIREGDVVRSTVVRHNDSRVIAARRVPTGTSTSPAFTPHIDFFDLTKPMSHSLVDRRGQPLHRASFGRSLVDGADYPANVRPDFSVSADSEEYTTLEFSGSNSAPDPSITGDFDTGFARTPDGAYTNHPDPGVYFTGGTPYFDQADDTSNTNSTVFSPQRIMPGPGMLGSLPTGVQGGIPWRTLLFRPDPQHFGSTGAPDHLLLDNFWMPVPEPHAISHDFSTDGKINLNYAMAPFTHIRRATAIHALLKAEKLMAIPVAAAPVYKTQTSDVKWRHFIDTEETLQQLEARFDEGDFFRSASEICEQYLVPEGQQLGAKVDGDYPDMRAFWQTHRLTGDNVKERPYTNLHTRLTTKSNHFKIYAIVQPITKAPESDPEVFNASNDTLGQAVPVSATLRRLLDGTPDCADPDQSPRDIPSYLVSRPESLPPLDDFYRYSITGAQPDLHQPIELEEVTHDETGEVSIRWQALSSDVFIIERSTDLKDWEVIDSYFGGTAPFTEFTDPSPPAGIRVYYRVGRR